MKQIPLSRGLFALVDDEHFKSLNQWKWYASKAGRTFYAQRQVQINKQRVTIHMHRLVLCADIQIDHRDGNGLNNQRHNLRAATLHQNNMNVAPKHKNKTSKYKGVYKPARTTRWEAQIKFNYKSISLGRFDTEEQAAMAYNEKAKELFGEFAWLNVIA